MFGLTTVDWRKEDLKDRLSKCEKLVKGEKEFELEPTGEDGVSQIRALLGLEDLLTNVNIPNYGQIPNLPLGAVVESNAIFTDDSVTPVFAGNIPENIYSLIAHTVGEQQQITKAALTGDLEVAFQVFSGNMLVNLPLDKSRKLFDEMIENTKKYLKV